MYAVINAGGKQHRVEAGSRVVIDRVEAESGSELEFREVLLVSDGDKTEIGSPYVENAVVRAEVEDQIRDRKVLVFHKKPRKGFKRLRGHRQPYTVARVKDISLGG